jgi:hypothetical protein
MDLIDVAWGIPFFIAALVTGRRVVLLAPATWWVLSGIAFRMITTAGGGTVALDRTAALEGAIVIGIVEAALGLVANVVFVRSADERPTRPFRARRPPAR